ncbi:DUF3829 domain-containing protein [Chryseobacterium indoltheticum]|uniref:DUF3829 domain-containing protein n=1 Tax=Chryseobacterium indoltheticum TaxID=254 RepID=A0A3G6N1F2_9FLAO|nr:DUF3829 domain-containing protein [Chryseobacterium indoltheticum]AZA59725.1 DUF3829 domain-containing protein [Chryseobacterium indoltheticum]
MKKVMMVALALSLSAASVSCKKGMDKIGNAVLKAGENESQAIIDFNNDFLDSYKTSSRHIENIVKYAEAAVKKSKGETVYSMPVVIGSMDYSLSKIKGIPSGFENDKTIIETDFNTYKAKRESIEKKYEELKSYITSEDYKDDKGAKAEALQKDINVEAQAFFTAGENVLTKIKSATDTAEEVILKDHPMKEFILSSKTLMTSMDSVMDVLDKQYTGGFNEAEAQKKYDEFEKVVAINTKKVFNVKEQQYAYKKTEFENVNKKAADFLDKYRKLIRDSKSTGRIADSNINEMDSAYESVLNSYNSFVK